MRGLGCEAPRTSSEASVHANWVYSHDIVSRKPRSAVFSFLALDRSSWLVIMKHSGTLVCVLVAASVAAAAAAAAVTAGWWAASAAAWASGTKHPAPRGRITRPFTAGFERVVAITSYARLQVAAMRLAQRHAGVGLAAALRLVLVVVHCSTCFCQGVRSTFAQCTAAAGRLYGWRPAEG